VTGFGLPAQRGHIHAHDRAGVRKPPGKEGAGLGTRLSGRYGDLAGADGCNECLSR